MKFPFSFIYIFYQLVEQIIDTITTNSVNKMILDLPAALQLTAAERLGLDLTNLAIDLDNAPRALLIAGVVRHRYLPGSIVAHTQLANLALVVQTRARLEG